MIFPSDEKWNEWGISQDVHKFFLLRWEEIFNSHTFDSWQIRSSNILTILDEMVDSLLVVDKLHNHHVNLAVLISEAKNIIKFDKVIKKSFPFVSNLIQDLDNTYKSDIKNPKIARTDRFLSIIQVIKGNLTDYRTNIENQISHILESTPTHYKIDLYSLSMAYGVFLKSLGYSIDSLYNSISFLVDPTESLFHRRFENLVNYYNGQSYKYECRFLLKWPGKLPNSESFGIQFLSDHPHSPLSNEESKFYNQDIKALIAILNVTALDYMSARCKAEEKLESLFAIRRLYSIRKPVVIEPSHDVLVKHESGEMKLVADDMSWRQLPRDARQINEYMSSLTYLLTKIEKNDADQLTASLQYHRIGISAATDEARLVNFWIALETLFSDGGSRTIDTICKYVPLSNTTSLTSRLIRGFATGILKYWRTSNIKTVHEIFPQSTDKIIHPHDLLNVFLNENDKNLFIKFLNNHPLAIYRIDHLAKDYFNKPKTYRGRLMTHTQIVEWQIRRIYRARNYIMHRGNCAPGTRQLIYHLHNYYLVTIHNLIRDLGKYPQWNLKDAFEYRLFIYKNYIDKLNCEAWNDIHIKFLYDPTSITIA